VLSIACTFQAVAWPSSGGKENHAVIMQLDRQPIDSIGPAFELRLNRPSITDLASDLVSISRTVTIFFGKN
jgi:hypothetical protein